MTGFQPQINISVDEATGNIRAAYVRVRGGKVHETREVAEGQVFADYGKDGLLLGIELLSPCGVEVLDRIARDEPEHIKRFLMGSPSRVLVPA